MPLLSFTPSVGPGHSVAYNLPTEQKRSRGLDGVDDSIQAARLQGKLYGAGSGMPFFSSGTADCVFQFTPDFGYNRGFGSLSDMALTESAVGEFYSVVVKGGWGTLIDSPPTGYRIVDDAGIYRVCTSRACTARVVPGSFQTDWEDGGTVCLVTVSLEASTGFWSVQYVVSSVTHTVMQPFH